MISITGISIGSLPYEDYLAPLVALVVIVTALTATVGAVYFVGRYVRLAIRQWTAPSMQPFYKAIGQVWNALVGFLRRLLTYPVLPNGWAKWRPIGLRQAVKALPPISGSLLFMGLFTWVTIVYGWYGLGNPKLSLVMHATIIAYLIAAVSFARMLMVRGVKIWHGLL
ncbi:hypothetical protein [Neorhizobium sp. DT-125]|uniref:hypothetical protein n=1 Tax=Neorhizobium sp. DT-125 TaxID=3396163 RepID=UPI003F1BE681